jgi:hypothetical protein
MNVLNKDKQMDTPRKRGEGCIVAAYSIDNLRKAREKTGADDMLASIPLDAPHNTDDAIGFWNGSAFVSWNEWMLSRPQRCLAQTTNKGPKSL